jgi:D-alanyl-lipoteichoic acid acyltransferase DltB (MBOAT superfamily)
MGFNSLDYLLFLGFVLGGYWLLAAHQRMRLSLVIVASCAFYMAWQPHYIGLLLASTAIDFTVGRGMGRATSARIRKAWLALSLTANLGLLGTFKYFDFFSGAVAQGLGAIGVHVTPARLDLLLPIGISFYTFECLSYAIDVYRGKLAPEQSFLRFAFFVTFFPHLVAGPIVRPADLLPQLARPPQLTPDAVSSGLFLIATGLIKKVALADYVAVNLVDRVFDTPSGYSAAEVMLALYAYTLQIYCDFSGYTDVARGSARLFGLSLPENFDRPYQAASPAEFWRRWHMTLSTWLRDYLYYPLGGSKVPPVRAYLNLGLTMFLIGLWHGAAWTFVLYGLLQATAMVTHRYLYRRAGRSAETVDSRPLHALKVIGTLHFVVLSRILFRSSDLGNAGEIVERLLGGELGLRQVSGGVLSVLLIGFAAHYTPRGLYRELERRFVALPAVGQGGVLSAVAAGLMMVASEDVVPYIYFQF